MNSKTTSKQSIRNPEKWVGKKVTHMANWYEFAWGQQGYVICEQTGKMIRTTDAGNWGNYFESIEEAEAAGYDDCYYYSDEGLAQLASRSTKLAA